LLLTSVSFQTQGFCESCHTKSNDLFVRFLCGHLLHLSECFPLLLASAVTEKRLVYIPAPYDMYSIGCPACVSNRSDGRPAGAVADREAMRLAGRVIYQKYQSFAMELRQHKEGTAMYCPCCGNLMCIPEEVKDLLAADHEQAGRAAAFAAKQGKEKHGEAAANQASPKSQADRDKEGLELKMAALRAAREGRPIGAIGAEIYANHFMSQRNRTKQILVKCPYKQCEFCARCLIKKQDCACGPASKDPAFKGSESTKKTEDLINRTTRACPYCGTRASHFLGQLCHHIAPGTGCPGNNKDGTKCGKHWCYYCLEPWEPTTDYDTRHHGHVYCGNVEGGCKVCALCPLCNRDHGTHFDCHVSGT